MTDNEIIKALEGKLPLGIHAIHEAIDLINRQKAEIERLKGEVKIKELIINKLKTGSNAYVSLTSDSLEYFNIKAEAVKEFAEKYERYLLSQLTTAPLDKKEWINFCLDELDKLRKEMAGES